MANTKSIAIITIFIFFIFHLTNCERLNEEIHRIDKILSDNMVHTLLEIFGNTDRNCMKEKTRKELLDIESAIEKKKAFFAAAFCISDEFYYNNFDTTLPKAKNKIYAENLDCFQEQILDSAEDVYLEGFDKNGREERQKECIKFLNDEQEIYYNVMKELYMIPTLFTNHEAFLIRMIILANGNYSQEVIETERNQIIAKAKSTFEREILKDLDFLA
ncbi:hypothetical protein PVAND_017238 [Polypedilum vanderplanki]|uniref:Uncharacterized protein n=1 Tax=Polypedilum vanderplanki TaxID=319348 RepID=A0A9J6BIV2_POLVA|nr:hypothetical protein PVAND_017238 [Polypedilum vanderplanki]